MASSVSTISRKQLQGYGASRYLARKLTVSLTPVAKSGNAYVYALDQVISAIRAYSQKTRIQIATRQVLEKVVTQLLARLDNVVPLVTGNKRTEVSDVTQQLLQQMRRTDKALSDMKATVASMGEDTN